MSQDRSTQVYGLLIQSESVYGGGAALDPATDMIPIIGDTVPEFNITYAHEGDARMISGRKVKRFKPTGLVIEGTFQTEVGGLDGATSYSLTVRPPLHIPVQTAGYSGSFQGSDWIYKRNPVDTWSSCAARLYGNGTQREMSGSYCDVVWSFEEAGAPLIAEFTIRGMGSVPTAATFPTTVAYTMYDTPIATDVTWTIDSVTTLVVRSMELVSGRDISQNRLDANATTGIAGIAPSDIPDSTWKITVEASDDFDAFTYRDLATEFAASMIFGSTAGQNCGFTAATCVIIEVNEASDGNVSTWELLVDIHNSDPGQRDDLTLTFFGI